MVSLSIRPADEPDPGRYLIEEWTGWGSEGVRDPSMSRKEREKGVSTVLVYDDDEVLADVKCLSENRTPFFRNMRGKSGLK